MDKMKFYRECVCDLLLQETEGTIAPGELEMQVVFDRDRDRYLAIVLGWQGDRRTYICMLHLAIREGKVWVQRNQTDRSVVAALVEMGVAREDIVLGLVRARDRELVLEV